MAPETIAVAGKATSTAGASIAVFGFTWWSVVFALVGAFVAIHFQKEAKTQTIFKTMGQIGALAFVGIMVAVWIPFCWDAALQVPIEIRAGTGGLLSNLIYQFVERKLAKKGEE